MLIAALGSPPPPPSPPPLAALLYFIITIFCEITSRVSVCVLAARVPPAVDMTGMRSEKDRRESSLIIALGSEMAKMNCPLVARQLDGNFRSWSGWRRRRFRRINPL